MEGLTQNIAGAAWKLIEEIEALGGMTQPIEEGIPKMRIEEAAAKKQARIDSGQDIIVGLNRHRLEKEDPLQTLEVDNTRVRKEQMQRLAQMKRDRDQVAVDKALANIRSAAQKLDRNESDHENLLALAVEAARARASLGEISDAMESAFGRYKAKIQTISGVYSKEIKDDESFGKARKMADEVAMAEGRRPRIMVAKRGQDGHDRGAKVVATGYADLGFDVDIGPLFQTPAEVAKQAVENDVHVLGISSLAGGHKTLVPQLVGELKE